MQNLESEKDSAPILSIVTVTAFEDKRLQKTLRSFENLDLKIEHVLVFPERDTVAIKIIEDYKKESKHKVISVNDSGRGIYSAMNLGIKVSNGIYLLFLNAGDEISNQNQLSRNIQELISKPTVWAILGCTLPWNEEYSSYNGMDRDFLLQRKNSYVSHQSVVVSKKYMQDVQGFDTRFKIAADTYMTMQLSNFSQPLLLKGIAIRVEEGNTVTSSNRMSRFETFIAILKQKNSPRKLIAISNFMLKEFEFLSSKIRRICFS